MQGPAGWSAPGQSPRVPGALAVVGPNGGAPSLLRSWPFLTFSFNSLNVEPNFPGGSADLQVA